MEGIPDLAGATIVITGGGSGIGEAAVGICAEAGARVIFCGRDAARLEAARDRLPADRRSRTQAIAADVSRPDDVAHLFARAAECGPVDGVIHAAAVLGPIGDTSTVDPRAWLRAVEIDLFGTFLVVRAACDSMRGRGGRIALFSGGGASGPFPNYSAYGCSKVAVVRLAETVAEEMAPSGIEINCIAPGFVATGLHDGTMRAGPQAAGAAYYARTRDLIEAGGVSPGLGARAAAFYVSRAAAGVTGKFISAVHDDWETLPARLADLPADAYTLRRIVPEASR